MKKLDELNLTTDETVEVLDVLKNKTLKDQRIILNQIITDDQVRKNKVLERIAQKMRKKQLVKYISGDMTDDRTYL